VRACSEANYAHVGIAGGPSQTIGCGGQVKLGPLTPRRNYEVTATAMFIRHGTVIHRGTAPALSVYLPGDDGNWILLNP
jgi:hypothetical protein